MPVECPHCAKEIVDFVPLARLNETLSRNKELVQASKAYEAELGELRPLKAQLGELTAAQERAAAFSGYDLPESHQKRYESWYRTEQDGVPDADRLSLADWLKAQEEDPVVGPGLRAVVKGAKAEPAKPPAKPPAPPPREPPATQPPAKRASAVPTPEELGEKYASREFLALPVAERKAIVAADRDAVASAGRA